MTDTETLIERYDRPGPRYTSYPTAMEFHPGVGEAAYAERLRRAAARPDDPLGLYLHLPFCAERCLYCGCNVVITRKRHVAGRYLELLQREIGMVAQRLGGRRRLRQMHWGGGTPTYLTPAELRALFEAVGRHFEIEGDAELAVEIDPRVTTAEHLETLRRLGFNRLSLGVQDFTREVQERVNRIQSFDDTRALVERARALGFPSINVDLIYGLPLQRPETFRRTLQKVLWLRPERMAVYSYAHVPWMRVQQRRIEASELPPPAVKLELIASALDAFRAAGYLAIGMDHFALPEDELGRALADGTLWRNFMGYTVRHAPDLVACGLSGIGDVAGAYVQNERKLSRYQQAVAAGRLPVERGVVRSPEDELRRYAITSLMCTFRLDFADLEKRFAIDARRHFAAEIEALRPLADDGLVRLGEDGIDVEGDGRLFVRNACMVFDAYLQRHPDTVPRFSHTV